MKKVIVKPVGPTDVIKTCPEASGRDSEPSSTGLQTSALLSSAQRDSGMDVGGGRKRNTHQQHRLLQDNSPGHLHQRYGHRRGVDRQVSVQINYDADVEHVDADWKTETETDVRRCGGKHVFILISPAHASCYG